MAFHEHIESPGFGRPPIHAGPRPGSIGLPARCCSTSNRGALPAPIRFPPDNFKHSLTLFSKSFSSLPCGTFSLSVSRPYLALDGIHRPNWAAFSNNPTRRQRLMVRQGPGMTGLSPSSAPPSRGLGPGPPLRMLLQTIIRTTEPPYSKAGLFSIRSSLLNKSFRIPLVHTSSKLTVRRAGKAPEGTVPSPSPGRHAATLSHRGSSSRSPPIDDGFGTGTPVPSPQSQSFSQTYGSILPTSLAYIIPSTRGCSPWRPDAFMSTTGCGRHSVLQIFKGRREHTGHHATCGALPATGPYLRQSRFQGGRLLYRKDNSS
ncbi:Protein TAR1 [Capsicum baccatum]|uniref:Protein TAR1 n=1 Tax=Capsicum baccatum TaxID=33114 RepID=A0A2G2UZT0_CAPBA|nr:Protein TAR1 [Capsicum baccatum]